MNYYLNTLQVQINVQISTSSKSQKKEKNWKYVCSLFMLSHFFFQLFFYWNDIEKIRIVCKYDMYKIDWEMKFIDRMRCENSLSQTYLELTLERVTCYLLFFFNFSLWWMNSEFNIKSFTSVYWIMITQLYTLCFYV